MSASDGAGPDRDATTETPATRHRREEMEWLRRDPEGYFQATVPDVHAPDFPYLMTGDTEAQVQAKIAHAFPPADDVEVTEEWGVRRCCWNGTLINTDVGCRGCPNAATPLTSPTTLALLDKLKRLEEQCRWCGCYYGEDC